LRLIFSTLSSNHQSLASSGLNRRSRYFNKD